MDQRDQDNWTPLHFAARFNHHDVVELLLLHSADINAQDHDGDEKPICLLCKHCLHLETRHFDDIPTHGQFNFSHLCV